ncbi:MAG TPA: hypothetical protein VIV60_11060, partial [Polyangiaceae bacterium]
MLSTNPIGVRGANLIVRPFVQQFLAAAPDGVTCQRVAERRRHASFTGACNRDAVPTGAEIRHRK